MVEVSVPLELVLKNPPTSSFVVRVDKKIINFAQLQKRRI